MIDMMMLIESGRPDANGQTIPMSVTAGSAVIQNAAGRRTPVTLVVSGGTYNPVTATCGTVCINCCGYNNFVVMPSNYSCPVGTSMQCSLQGTDCNGGTATFSANWSSSNTAVMTVNSSGLLTGVAPGTATISAQVNSYIEVTQGQVCSGFAPVCQTGKPGGSTPDNATPVITSISPPRGLIGVNTNVTISGKGFGTSATVNTGSGIKVTNVSSSDTTITCTFQVASNAPGGNNAVTVSAGGQSSNSENFYVQVPTKVSKASSTFVLEWKCGTASCGSGQHDTWQFLDQESPAQPILSSGLDIYDTVTISSTDDFNFKNLTPQTTCPGNSGPCGVFTDQNGVSPTDKNDFCSSLCFSNGSCINPSKTSVVIQTWHANGYTLSASLNTVTFTCGSVKVNGN